MRRYAGESQATKHSCFNPVGSCSHHVIPPVQIWKSNKALLRQWWGVHASAPAPPVSVGGFPSRAIFQIKCRPVSISALLFDSEGDTCSAMTSISLHPIRISEFQLHFFFLLPQIKSPSVWSVCVVCLWDRGGGCILKRLCVRLPVLVLLSTESRHFCRFKDLFKDIFPTHFPPWVRNFAPIFIQCSLSGNTNNLPLRPTLWDGFPFESKSGFSCVFRLLYLWLITQPLKNAIKSKNEPLSFY